MISRLRAALAWASILLLVSGCAGGLPSSKDRLTNTVTWATASESDNFGFDVYRSTVRSAPFERLTVEPVAGGGTTDLPRSYRFVDDEIEAGQEYFYYVESISLSGERKRFTPVMRAPPKYPADR